LNPNYNPQQHISEALLGKIATSRHSSGWLPDFLRHLVNCPRRLNRLESARKKFAKNLSLIKMILHADSESPSFGEPAIPGGQQVEFLRTIVVPI
jgi:hypothetical protein